MKIAIVLPAYNEEKHIVSVLAELKKTNLLIVVIDDGSTDTTSLKLRAMGKSGKVVVLTHKVNLGKGAAMKTGADFAFSKGYGAVVFMDSDSQHNPHDLTHFTEALSAGYEIVYGSRNMQMGMPFVRYIGNKAASILVNVLFGVYISDILCGFRGITKNAYKKIKWESSGYAVETEMIIRAAKKQVKFTEVPVQTLYHDNFKGVTIFDAFGILFAVIRWKLVLK